MPQAHHQIFKRFRPWRGLAKGGAVANFLGVMTRTSIFTPDSHPSIMAHPRVMRLTSRFPRYVVTRYPRFDEEYFEWVAVLEAVAAARDDFTMIELGAGWGRWLVNAAAALRYRGGPPCRLVGVEADHVHFEWMKAHFRENGLDPEQHSLIEAAVLDKEGEAFFYAGRPSAWYGQTVAPDGDPKTEWDSAPNWVRVCKVRTITLNSLLDGLERVDLVDADIQGVELSAFTAGAELLDRRVRRVSIMTHEPQDVIEPGLRALFTSLGWENVYDYSCKSKSPTPWGILRFRDGVQQWTNPKL